MSPSGVLASNMVWKAASVASVEFRCKISLQLNLTFEALMVLQAYLRKIKLIGN